MINFNTILETDDLLLRPMIADDYFPFATLTPDPSLWEFFTVDLSVRSELLAWVTSSIDETKNNTRLAFTIIDKTTRSIAGSTSFGNISYRDKRVEIGWTWLGRTFQGRGINDKVKHLMLGYVFGQLFFERVEMKTDVLNIPARKALQRIGATQEGILRSHTLLANGRRRDTIYYSILREEWYNIVAKLNKATD